jgi:glutamine---fructose-6-phosphate transaminase (isomerizing)
VLGEQRIMCGIVGILGREPVAGAIFEALKRLEYRGYDSAGIAVLENGSVERVRAPGKLGNLKAKMNGNHYLGTTGIGHTRWATHGAPNETNAHPHIAGDVVVVHNGIIENFQELKDELLEQGIKFATDTDTEVVAQLIARERGNKISPREAVANVLKRLEGAFALAIIFEGENDLMFGARMGAPLAVGHGEGQMFLGSDAIALAPFTNRVTYLEDGDWVALTRRSIEVIDAEGRHVVRPMSYTQASAFLADKGKHKHFMAKEIAEQPEVVGHTLAEYIDFANRTVKLPENLPFDFARLDKLTITACGTASYAGLTAKYWFERIARLPTEVDVASEFRYREAPLSKGGLSIVISQSGETADTLAALRYCKTQGQHTLAIVNVPESTIARESEAVLHTYAGPEIGVASTKAFTCQLAVLAALAIAAARARGAISLDKERELVGALIEAPRHMSEILKEEKHIADIARDIAHARDVLYLGRGINFPIALEGALKLKEISYIHAEGYAAGELKHGPIALIDEGVPVIVVAPRDDLYDKTVSNMEEVAARGGKIVLLTDAQANGGRSFARIRIPKAHDFISPLLYAIPVQLLAYHAAVFMGTDVDQPRNLAKSVTVE